jgi:hypothetical protein
MASIRSTFPAASVARRAALDLAVRLWFIVTAIGQTIFFLYITGYYAPPVTRGTLADWSKYRDLITGHVPGDTVGNAMFGVHVALAALLFGSLAGCAGSGGTSNRGSWLDPMQSRSPMYTGVSPSAAQSRALLNGAAPCCDALSSLRFEPLSTERSEFHTIDGSSQAFVFSAGKSLLRAFAIPSELTRATLTLESVAGATVFAPTVLILDGDFRVSRAIDADNFVYTPAGFMEPQRLKGSFSLDRRTGSDLAGERYLVVFTTAESLKGSTQMISEAALYAQARGLANPRLPDPVAEHAATGVFRLSFSDVESGARPTVDGATQREAANRYVPASKTAAPATVRSSPPRASGKPASELLHVFDPVPQLLKNVRYDGGAPLENDHVKAVIAEAEAALAGKGRLVIRPSGTEPVIRVMAEGDDRAEVEQVVDAICEAVRAAV